MTTADEKEFELLHSEADYCNLQIGNFFELQIKILGLVVTAVGVSLSLLFANGREVPHALPATTSAKVLVALSGVMSFAVIQGTISYGLSLGYIHYKNLVVGLRLKTLLGLSGRPLASVKSILEGSAGIPVRIASGLATVGILAVNFSTLVYAWNLAAGHPKIYLMVGIAGIGLAAAVFCAILAVRAAKQVGNALRRADEQTTEAPNATP